MVSLTTLTKETTSERDRDKKLTTIEFSCFQEENEFGNFHFASACIINQSLSCSVGQGKGAGVLLST